MYQSGFTPFMNMEYKRRHEELMKQANEYRMLVEARKAGPPKMRSTSKILALVGKGLARLGASLEERYGSQTETNLASNQQSDPYGCA